MNNLLTLTPEQFCEATKACAEGREWAITQPTMADVWDHCPRGDWLVWLAQRLNAADDRTLRLFAVWCARWTPIAGGRETGTLLFGACWQNALVVAEQLALGQASEYELDSARRLACGDFSIYADSLENDQLYAAAAAETAALTVGHCAIEAADLAVCAAYFAAPDAIAADISVKHARLAQANMLRGMVRHPFRPPST
jgi:hypothetical protein